MKRVERLVMGVPERGHEWGPDAGGEAVRGRGDGIAFSGFAGGQPGQAEQPLLVLGLGEPGRSYTSWTARCSAKWDSGGNSPGLPST